MKKSIALACVIVLGLWGVARADLVDNIPVSIDTHIYSHGANNNYGTATELIVKKGGAGDGSDSYYNNRALLAFELPDDIVSISGATLYLYMTNQVSWGGAATDIEVYRVIQDAWTELGATWNNYDGTNAWDLGGCRGQMTDFDNNIMASVSLPAWSSDHARTVAWDVTAMAQTALGASQDTVNLRVTANLGGYDAGRLFAGGISYHHEEARA